MLPKVIVHNLVSVDGSIDGYEPDVGAYYAIASRFGADAILVGSNTLFLAAEQYPPEEPSDFVKPAVESSDTRPLWVVPDSRGRLRNLHVFRGTEYCRDILVLVSKTTPQSYLDYLTERHYDFIVAGEDHVDYRQALEILHGQYGCRVIRTDSGGILNNALLEEGLVDEISLIISPVLVGAGHTNLFRSLHVQEGIVLRLIAHEILDNDQVLLIYRVNKAVSD